MLKTDFKHSITYFFLVAFLLLRVANLHSISHTLTDVEYEHCEVCDLIANTNQNTPLQSIAPQPEVSLVIFSATDGGNSLKLYVAPYQKTLLSDYFHNKPPPFSS